jgi:hypothetical protein
MATTVCLICGTRYSTVLRRKGERCNDLSLVARDRHEIGGDDGCVGRVVSQADYDRIDQQAEARNLATRRDLHYGPLLRRKP